MIHQSLFFFSLNFSTILCILLIMQLIFYDCFFPAGALFFVLRGPDWYRGKRIHDCHVVHCTSKKKEMEKFETAIKEKRPQSRLTI